MPTVRVALMLIAAGACAAGCNYVEELTEPIVGEAGERLADDADPFEPRPFPVQTPMGQPLDISVIPDKGRVIRLDNRSVHSYQNAELWLNQQYGAKISEVAIAQSGAIALSSFINEHGEPYPTASFLASDRYSPLVAADLIVDGKMHKLHVRLDDWRHP